MTTADKVVAKYREIREERAQLAKDYKEVDDGLKAQLSKIEAAMLGFLNKHGLDSAPTQHGVFYKQEQITPSGADWEAFYKWVAENNAFDALERRIKSTFIKEYMETNDNALPPGVNVFREYVVRVRKS